MLTILGLGSNLNNRTDYLQQAVELLAGYYGETILHHPTLSPIYESDALLLPDSPPEWNMPFLNMAIKGECTLSPYELLARVKQIELTIGRQERTRWAPREIDIDILAYGSEVIQAERLIIPHPHLLDRPFAIQPLADLIPDWQYPIPGEYYGKTARELARRVTATCTRKVNVVLAFNPKPYEPEPLPNDFDDPLNPYG